MFGLQNYRGIRSRKFYNISAAAQIRPAFSTISDAYGFCNAVSASLNAPFIAPAPHFALRTPPILIVSNSVSSRNFLIFCLLYSQLIFFLNVHDPEI